METKQLVDIEGRRRMESKALNFKSVQSQGVELGQAFDYDWDDTFSFSFWLASSATAGEGVILGKQLSAGDEDGYIITFPTAVTPYFFRLLFNVGAEQLDYYYQTGDINDGILRHFVVTLIGGFGRYVYMNGSLLAESGVGSLTTGSVTGLTSGFGLGMRYTEGGTHDSFADITLKNLAVYEHAFTAQHALDLYNIGLDDPYERANDVGVAPVAFYSLCGLPDAIYKKIHEDRGTRDGTFYNMDEQDFVPVP